VPNILLSDLKNTPHEVNPVSVINTQHRHLLAGYYKHGNNLIQQNKTQFQAKKKPVLDRISKELSFIK
jgi:hypothetical protein